jgi:hypothetical protein
MKCRNIRFYICCFKSALAFLRLCAGDVLALYLVFMYQLASDNFHQRERQIFVRTLLLTFSRFCIILYRASFEHYGDQLCSRNVRSGLHYAMFA